VAKHTHSGSYSSRYICEMHVSDIEYSDEEIHLLLLQITAAKQATAGSDKASAEAKPTAPAPRSEVGVTRELSIEEILKKIETEMADKKPAPSHP